MRSSAICIALNISILICLSFSQTRLEPEALRQFMYTDEITGILQPLRPTKLGSSVSFHLPVDTYEIGMVRTKLQLLPTGFPQTEVFAYASKVNGKWKAQYPGPFIQAFSDTPCYVVFSNELEGGHFLPVDFAPPFHMMEDFRNQVPTVIHLHGLETQMGSDGDPMAYWTKSGKRGEVFFSLNSRNLKKNQAIYRFYNTKEGLYWYHDHTMAITRLNVYAGLVGLYEIINPKISSEESNVLRIYGNVERKHFAINDKSFNTDGSLSYPNTSFIAGFTWVPGFSGNVMMVNGKVWPKLSVQQKIYRFSMLNACNGRYLRIYFETENGTRLPFELFRRDSDFLQKATPLTELLIINGARTEIFIDFSKVTGSVFMKNDAPSPFPSGQPTNEFLSSIMRIDIQSGKINLQQLNKGASARLTTSSAESNEISVNTFIDAIRRKTDLYEQIPVDETIDFVDQPQAPRFMLPSNVTGRGQAADAANAIRSQGRPKIQSTVNLTSLLNQSQIRFPSAYSLTVSAAETAANVIRTSATSPMGNTKGIDERRIPLIQFLNNLRSHPMFNSTYFDNIKPNINLNITNVAFPRFREGKQFVTVLDTASTQQGTLSGLFIDGIPVQHGCDGATFRQGEIYDFYIVNTMTASHPIHIHLANFQIIHRFAFNVSAYKEEFARVNGPIPPRGYARAPKQVNPLPFRTSDFIPPLQTERLFMDLIQARQSMVTVARFRIANHQGQAFPFSIAGMRYVYHCHILEHEDNQMMRYFCIE